MKQAETFRAFVVEESPSGTFERKVKQKYFHELPENEVLIAVKYAGLNYKDALSAFGHKGITRKYPHTPGVDAAGVVVEDSSGKFKVGQKVICTSYDLGMNTDGAFSQYIRVPASWVLLLPDALSLKESMILGTAAYTAGLALYKMECMGQVPEMGPVVVTGATGGVGSMAVALLSKAGYRVMASTGKTGEIDYLKSLGAVEIVGRAETCDRSGRPLLKQKWAGAIDNVGGETLVTLLKACGRNGSVASIGLVESPEFSMTVYPFILNGVNLLGVDSAETPMVLRQQIWERLAGKWRIEHLDEMSTIISLDQLDEYLALIRTGKTKGRVVVAL